ncbi:polyphosphate kinase 2 [Empedobacter falsenii]|uniref:ADP/GDP-polyphosphate phosphotransferase n=1 Tax=Empedobacter falsenii TaxID=343874 RepID=A0ABY8VCQ9_9FLAO|nr:polyphosphate kinase 2 [Empedobacter falsenii]WIH98063.1 polyphosphate kinase 2 [Empedobacter falsenii]
MELKPKDLKLIETKKGLVGLLQSDHDQLNFAKALRTVKYEKRIEELQEELIKLQTWVANHKKKVVIVFEGRDAAGKGGAIRRIVEHLNPREHRIVALPKPNEVESGQWYFQRYVRQLPREGEIVFYDRSWYNRAVVEPVNGFCTQDEYAIFMNEVNDVEKMWINSGIYLIKIYFSITKEQQMKRFNDIVNSPIKRWKYSSVDQKAQDLFEVYSEYKDKMFELTHTKIAPWKIIDANKKYKARVEAMEYILSKIPYDDKNKRILKHQNLEVEM